MHDTLIRTSVRTLYDMQKIRIQAGNRIVASFRQKLGIEPGETEDTGNDDAGPLLERLRLEYKRITDGVTTITKRIKIDSTLLTSLGELKLMQAYEQQLDAEAVHLKLIEYELENYPVYREFLKPAKGCGPMMAAVILSEIDITKCNSISALWAYAGLDVVVTVDETTGEITEEGRCRKAHHLAPKTYTDRDGNIKQTRGITFNPFLKTKLIGVLGSSFLKCGGPYRTIYDNYKHRLEHHPKWAERSKGHRHNAAIRYAVKEFLADLWTVWRQLEGLPVRPRYNEEKLGIVHSRAA